MFRFIALIALIGFCAAAPLDSEAAAETKLLENEASPDGNYHYTLETSNGILMKVVGDANNAQGEYSYTAPDGTVISVQYKGSENGYEAFGPFVPTPPPVPELIVRSLAYLAAHPQKEELIRKV